MERHGIRGGLRFTGEPAEKVRVEIGKDNVPDGELSEALERRLVEAAERWAEACIADRHAEVSEL